MTIGNESIYNNPVRGDKMGETKARKEWTKKNTTYFGIKLQNSTDADILAALDGAESKQGEIKRLLRVALEMEKNSSGRV